jgi:small subunit ribosomal protein S8
MSTTSTDPIADMFTRIRNAIAVNKSVISLPHSSIKESVARLLQDSNFIDKVDVSGENISKIITIRIND